MRKPRVINKTSYYKGEDPGILLKVNVLYDIMGYINLNLSIHSICNDFPIDDEYSLREDIDLIEDIISGKVEGKINNRHISIDGTDLLIKVPDIDRNTLVYDGILSFDTKSLSISYLDPKERLLVFSYDFKEISNLKTIEL